MNKKQLSIHFLLQILDLYEFSLYTEKNKDQELVFKLEDCQWWNLWNIESDEFYNLSQVIDRLDIYHNDYIYEPLLELWYTWENRDQLIKLESKKDDDCDRDLTVSKFICSDKIFDILKSITPTFYQKYKDKCEKNRVKSRENYNYRDIKNYLE